MQRDRSCFSLTKSAAEKGELIGREIQRAASNVPWNAVCLPQAIAGKWMLKRRGIESDLFLGLAKDHDNALQAHAWLIAGTMPVTGVGIETFKQVGRFC